MTTTTCDLCGELIPIAVIKLTLPDGMHPHCGEPMSKTVDVCPACIPHVPGLSASTELETLRHERWLRSQD